jgi:hypothetical protein
MKIRMFEAPKSTPKGASVFRRCSYGCCTKAMTQIRPFCQEIEMPPSLRRGIQGVLLVQMHPSISEARVFQDWWGNRYRSYSEGNS